MHAVPAHHYPRPAARGPSGARPLALRAVLVAGACDDTRVARIVPASVTDLSGRWNDADSPRVGRAVVRRAFG